MSIDKDNIWDAEEPYRKHHKDLRLAFLDKDYSRAMRLAVTMAERGAPDLDPDDSNNLTMCPSENPYMKMGGKMLEIVNLDRRDVRQREVMLAEGITPRRKNPNLRGACVDCRVCYGGRNKHVVFADVHKMNVSSTGHHDEQGDFGLVGTGPIPVAIKPRVRMSEVNQNITPHPTLF
jgi:hypothetical protein